MEVLHDVGFTSAIDRAAAMPMLTPIPLSFLAGSVEGQARIPTLVYRMSEAVRAARAFRTGGPLPAGRAADVLAAVAAALGPPEMPPIGIGDEAALRLLAITSARYGLDLAHPAAAAHLQPPPLSVAVAADLLASSGNASLDTYDSGPSAIAFERWVVAGLAKLAGFGEDTTGVLTPGGSISNLMALLLARDAAAFRRGVDARRDGVAALPKPVIFCSELAHFSIHRACAALGLGEAAVWPVPVDERHRMRPRELERMLASLRPDCLPLAIVATAGTTDFGSVDPLGPIADLAARYQIWMHVDAAYGFGALFSDQLAGRLAGLERADSVTLDLHKLGWQPAATSVLLVAAPGAFRALDREVAYLNPEDDAEQGLDGLLGRSLQTTRRADALKVAATFLAHGRKGLGRMVEACHELAGYAERRIAAEPELELVSPAELTTVVFRYCGRWPSEKELPTGEQTDRLNASLRRWLLEHGSALLGRTAVKLGGPTLQPRVCLKLTLLNPSATSRDMDGLIDAVLQAGRCTQQNLLQENAA